MNSIGDTARMRGSGFGLARSLPQSDRRLAKRAAAGEMAAFEAIFERYHQDLYRYCLSILRDPEDAQDALQNTIASAIRSLPGERRAVELRPWLFRVAHNSSISIVRARRPGVDPDSVAERPDPAEPERIEARERLRALLADLESLSEQRRAALTMRELSGLSFEQIGSALEISPQAARQAVYEARVDLRDLEQGRAMECDRVCELVSAGDGRALRGKQVRAHLRGCTRCQDFRQAIDRRSADLAALAPPLSPLVAAGLLKGALGGVAAAGGVAGAGAGAGLGISLTLKAAASVVAATAIGVGAADHAGLIDAPVVGDGREAPAAQPAPPAPAEAAPLSVPRTPAADARRGESRADRDRGGRGGRPDAPAGPKAGAGPGTGQPGHANGGQGAPAQAPPAAPPAGSSAGGQGAPDHANAGGAGAPAHANAGGTGAEASASATEAAPDHANAGGSPTATAQGGGRPADPGAPATKSFDSP